MKLIENLLDKYIKEHSTDENPVLSQLDRKTHLSSVQPRMLSGHIQGKILEMLVWMYNPRNILEIGTFTGYSAICMAKALNEGARIDSVDINDELNHIAREYISKSGFNDRITLHLGTALEIVPSLNQCFDFVFIDGDKREYVDYYDMLMDGGYVKSGSVMLADNVLWDGKVVDDSPKNLKDTYTIGIKEFNGKVKNDPRVEVVILPFRDGMSIIRVL